MSYQSLTAIAIFVNNSAFHDFTLRIISILFYIFIFTLFSYLVI